ncbi:MAG: stage V sporulation protein AE [Ruminococcaceae bacterium]|nr:stage V sporulation protein AE [Oscillospiraceae bacterium]
MGTFLDYLWAFLVGGALCVIAQILIDKTKITPARILVLYVCSGVVLTALGIYGPIAKFAGCGATVPLTGFGYAIAQGVEKAVDEFGLFGALTGGLTATSGGITTAIVLGYICSLIFSSKPKD